MSFLHIIIGPMMSSKTTRTIQLIRQYRVINKQMLLINHALDTRYAESHIYSHDGVKEPCISLSSLADLRSMELYKNADMVVIEEAHFFNDLYEFIVKELQMTNKYFIICGLSGDYVAKPFGQILDLVPHGNIVEKLHGFCKDCSDGTAGIYSKRIVESGDQVLIGAVESYKCVCRKHFYS